MPVPRITKETLKERLDAADPVSMPVIVDVRLKYPYEHSSLVLPGAIRLDPYAQQFDHIPLHRDVVTYDSDPDELVSTRVAAELIRRGYRASALTGGIADWLTANFPTEAKALSAPPPAVKG